MSAGLPLAPTDADRQRGLWLGLLGVAVFALTLPMTRLATGTTEAPQLSPWFVTWARAALAGMLSLLFLLATRARRPAPSEVRPLLLALAGNVIGFPLLLGWALRHVSHMTGGLTATQCIIIHTGQIIVHQGITMDQLDRHSCPTRQGIWRLTSTKCLISSINQRWPNAFPPQQNSMTHRVPQRTHPRQAINRLI